MAAHHDPNASSTQPEAEQTNADQHQQSQSSSQPHPHIIHRPARGVGALREAREHGARPHHQQLDERVHATETQDPRAMPSIQPTLPNQRALDKLAERENAEQAEDQPHVKPQSSESQGDNDANNTSAASSSG